MIWFKNYTVEEVQAYMSSKKGLAVSLDIKLFEIGDDFVKLRMPVNERLHQVHGIMHGGASCVLVETAGSIASGLCIDPDEVYVVGSQIHVNHLRPVKNAMLVAVAKVVHLGRQKHVWDISVYGEASSDKLICKGELTCAVVSANEYDR